MTSKQKNNNSVVSSIRKRSSPSPSSSSSSSSSSLASFLQDHSRPLLLLVVGVALLATWSQTALPLLLSWLADLRAPRFARPLAAPLALSTAELSNDLHQSEFLWGTYRPQAYFGVRARLPVSVLFGMLWSVHAGWPFQDLRHTCEQGDRLTRYGWTRHNGVDFGEQEIVDQGVQLTTAWRKRRDDAWTAHVRGALLPTTPKSAEKKAASKKENERMALFFYLGDENYEASQLLFSRNPDGLFSISGRALAIDDFTFEASSIESAHHEIFYYGARTPHFFNLTDHVKQVLQQNMREKQSASLPNAIFGRTNLIVVQINVQLPFEITLSFESSTSSSSSPSKTRMDIVENARQEFDEKFEDHFGLHQKGFSEEMVAFAKAAFSNLIGGIGYFYGQSQVTSSSAAKGEVVPYWRAGLYTAVPSRSFFPRGFLWDEGFHLLLIDRWNSTIAHDIIAHWLDLMNRDGWIPREQILGAEAKSKVPAEFVVQNSDYANPPTLLLPIERTLHRAIHEGSSSDVEFLRAIFPRLRAWYNWYETTQQGPVKGSYRWRGRDEEIAHELNPKTLTSGLDDFPRASHPSSAERHVDLRCWMTMASRIMMEITEMLGVDSSIYRARYDLLADERLLNDLHWDDVRQQYSDFGNHTDDVQLKWVTASDTMQRRLLRRLFKKGGNPEAPRPRFVSQFGYVNLFPFLMKLIDANSEKLGVILKDLRDERRLWSSFGLRSLSKDSSLYMAYNTEHDPPYWRGPVWLNINYLALGALRHYGDLPGPHQRRAKEIYGELRSNIINNVFGQYRSSGYIWEQYREEEEEGAMGRGHGSHPFTGWSSLVVLMMAELF